MPELENLINLLKVSIENLLLLGIA